MSPSRAAEAIRERGFALFEGLRTPDEVATLRDAIGAQVEAVGLDELYEPEMRVLDEGVWITPTGLALRNLLNVRPDLLDLILDDAVLAALREVLGDGMRLEAAGAVVSDSSRPFFRWHTHIGGEEESVRYRSGNWPTIERCERVLTLMYLDLLDDDGGPLLVLPRRLGEPTAPPGPLDAPSWPGQAEIRARPGTLVALEQCTWHAAFARQSPGWRMFVGCYFAAEDTPVADWEDPRLRDVPSDDPRLRALVR